MGLRELLGDQSSPRALGGGRRSGARRRVRSSGSDDGQPLPGLPIRNQPGLERGGISDWSGKNGWASNGQPDPQGSRIPAGRFQTESGAPFCANARGVSGVDTTTGGVDRRNLIVPIINCLAQTALGNITGAGASSKTPVAAFGKFFMTQPYTALKDGNLYGEITGAVAG